jgi:hypothetical protein
MTTFDEMLIADLDNVLLNTDELAEPATYYFAGGGKRSITVMEIGRWNEEKERSAGRYLKWTLAILCRNDATAGITEPKHGDKLILDANDLEIWQLEEVNAQSEHSFELQWMRTELIEGVYHEVK